MPDNGMFRRQMWAGLKAPASGWMAEPELWRSCTDHRLSPKHHQSFDIVDISEENLTSFKGWPVILDEALRLLTPGGELRFRAEDTRFGSLFEVMRRIYSWTNGDVVLLEASPDAESGRVRGVRLRKSEARRASLQSMDFVVVTNGSNPARVDRFIRSVRANANGLRSYKIIVSSPVEPLAHEVKAWGDDCFAARCSPESSAQLGERKNRAIELGVSENVLVVHDRYALSDDFVDELNRFGADFSVLICRQTLDTGTRFPDLVVTASDVLATKSGILNYGDWSPGVYVNGGAVLAKRDVFRAVPWNPLLMWGQREDVEWTRRLRDAGYEPRLCRHAVLVTLNPRPGYLAHFEPVPRSATAYLAPGDACGYPTIHTPKVRSLRVLHMRGRDFGALALKTGVIFGDPWTLLQNGAHIPANATGTFSMKLASRKVRSPIRLFLWGQGVQDAVYEAAGEVKIRKLPLGLSLLSLTAGSGATVVSITATSAKPIVIKALVLL